MFGREKPKVAVVGLGDYYSKLREALWRELKPTLLLDQKGSGSLALPASDAQVFKQVSDSEEIASLCRSVDLVLVLTPNDSHVKLAELLLRSGKPVVLEKPVATTTRELEFLAGLVRDGAPLYCSDFYVDARAAPLLYFAGRIPKRRSWLVPKLSPRRGFYDALNSLGAVSHIESRLMETYPFRRDTWLASEPSGGVVFDMLVHSIALLARIYPDDELQVSWCSKQFRVQGDENGAYKNRPSHPHEAEAYVRVEGRLASGCSVVLDAGKEAAKQERFFRIDGERGVACQRFGPPELLDVSLSGKPSTMSLDGDRYDLMVQGVRQWYLSGAPPYGWAWTEPTIRKLIEIKNWRPPSTTSHRRDVSVIEGPPSGGSEVSRRKFNLLLAGTVLNTLASVATIGSGLHDAADEIRAASGGRITESLQRAAEQSSKSLTEERLSDVARLVKGSGRLAFWPGSDHRYRRPKVSIGGAFPHDLAAVAPFRHLSDAPADVLDEVEILGTLGKGDVVIATGSPTTSRAARVLMESTRAISNLPYRITESSDDPFVRVYSGMEGGIEVEKKCKALVDEAGTELVSDRDNLTETKWLRQDVLLLSRLPGPMGVDFLLISGFHGAGTQAVELLFHPDVLDRDDLEKLLRAVGEAPYWQAVFDAEGVENIKPMSVARGLSLSMAFEPRVFEPRYSSPLTT